MKKLCITLATVLSFLSMTTICYADPMDPLNDLEPSSSETVTEAPHLNVILPEDPYSPGQAVIEESTVVIDPEVNLQERKEKSKKKKTKQMMDSIFWAVGILMTFMGLAFLTIYLLGLSNPLCGNFFAFITRHPVHDVNPVGYIFRCVLVGVVGFFLFTGIIETYILTFYSWIMGLFRKG